MRCMGIEPMLSPWKGDVLPLHQHRNDPRTLIPLVHML